MKPYIPLLWMACFAIGWLAFDIYEMATDSSYNPIYSVTKCRLCDKTVWAWQRYERRNVQYDVQAEDGGTVGLAVFASGSCIVHKGCKGEPKGTMTVAEVRKELNPGVRVVPLTEGCEQ